VSAVRVSGCSTVPFQTPAFRRDSIFSAHVRDEGCYKVKEHIPRKRCFVFDSPILNPLLIMLEIAKFLCPVAVSVFR